MSTLDPLTLLGVELKQPIPTGEAFVDELLDEHKLPVYVDALLKHGFTPMQVSTAIASVSRGMWTPYPENVELLYRQWGGKKWPRAAEEAA